MDDVDRIIKVYDNINRLIDKTTKQYFISNKKFELDDALLDDVLSSSNYKKEIVEFTKTFKLDNIYIYSIKDNFNAVRVRYSIELNGLFYQYNRIIKPGPICIDKIVRLIVGVLSLDAPSIVHQFVHSIKVDDESLRIHILDDLVNALSIKGTLIYNQVYVVTRQLAINSRVLDILLIDMPEDIKQRVLIRVVCR